MPPVMSPIFSRQINVFHSLSVCLYKAFIVRDVSIKPVRKLLLPFLIPFYCTNIHPFRAPGSVQPNH